MPSASPQSTVPNRRSVSALDGISTQPDLRVQGPRIISANGIAFDKTKRSAFRVLQNVGVTAVKYLVDDNGLASELNFHGILAAGSAEDDGLGSVVNFSVASHRVSVFGVGGGAIKLATFEGVSPENDVS